MSNGIDIFEQLIAMMLMGELDKYGLEVRPKVEVDEAEISKAEKDKECDEYMTGQAFYVGEHKHGERWN